MQPLAVDLDGTLILTDMLHESALGAFRERPTVSLSLPFWSLKGKAALKQQLARRFPFNPATLPYNGELINWLADEKKRGRQLILCTASDFSIASAVAKHLNLFDEVAASDGHNNLGGKNKAQMLAQRFGKGGFDYAGNSKTDLAVWQQAGKAVVVNGTANLLRKVRGICPVEKIFPAPKAGVSQWLALLRTHQWAKNILLFAPMFAAHDVFNLNLWVLLLFAFFSFSFCASAVYICNDLLDLESDRLHPRKRLRPFASGAIPVWVGVAVMPILILASISLGAVVGHEFLLWLSAYFIITSAYSLKLKRVPLVDCLTLAMLYTLRIICGIVAAQQIFSFWFLAFSVFLFLSLGFVKRYAELEGLASIKGAKAAHGRGYLVEDASLLQSMGIGSAYSSVIVLALYLNSGAVSQLYALPMLVWAAIPIMLFWVSWMWMQAHRGRMHDDPVIFAVTDRVSLVSGALFLFVMLVGGVGVPWLS